MPARLKNLTQTRSGLHQDTSETEDLRERVQALRQRNQDLRDHLDNLLRIYRKDLAPLYRQLGDAQLLIAHKLSEVGLGLKLGKAQVKTLQTVIVSLCREVLESGSATLAEQTFYQQWADGESTAGTPEEASQSVPPEEPPQPPRQRRKAPKDEPEQLHPASSPQKTLRTLYISLAKALHPDVEPHPAEKLRKEELMKTVTRAYGDNDLSALIKIEGECGLQPVTAEGVLTSLLMEIKALEVETAKIFQESKYKILEEFFPYSPVKGKQLMRENFRGLEELSRIYREILREIDPSMTKTEFMTLLHEFLQD